MNPKIDAIGEKLATDLADAFASALVQAANDKLIEESTIRPFIFMLGEDAGRVGRAFAELLSILEIADHDKRSDPKRIEQAWGKLVCWREQRACAGESSCAFSGRERRRHGAMGREEQGDENVD